MLALRCYALAISAHPAKCATLCSCAQKIVVTLSVPTGQSLGTQSLQATLSQVQDGCVL